MNASGLSIGGHADPCHDSSMGVCHNCGARLHARPEGRTPPPEVLSRFSDAQRRVLYFLLTGLTEPQIAERIGRSRHTVHDHTKALYAALGVKRRVQLVLLFPNVDPLDLLSPADRAEILAEQHAPAPTPAVVTPGAAYAAIAHAG